MLSDFEFSRESRSLPGEEDISASSSMRAGTRGYMAPEVESGEGAVFASDMYSFGVLLMFMHYPALASNIIPGSLRLPSSCELELADLIQHLTAVCYHHYSTTSFSRVLRIFFFLPWTSFSFDKLFVFLCANI